MDGLPVEEQTGLPYASAATQVDPLTGYPVFQLVRGALGDHRRERRGFIDGRRAKAPGVQQAQDDRGDGKSHGRDEQRQRHELAVDRQVLKPALHGDTPRTSVASPSS